MIFTTAEELLFFEDKYKSIEQKLLPLPADDKSLIREMDTQYHTNQRLLSIENEMKNVVNLSDKLNQIVNKQENELWYAETINASLKENTLKGENQLLEAQQYQYTYYRTIIGSGVGLITGIVASVPLGIGLVSTGIISVSSGLFGALVGYKW